MKQPRKPVRRRPTMWIVMVALTLPPLPLVRGQPGSPGMAAELPDSTLLYVGWNRPGRDEEGELRGTLDWLAQLALVDESDARLRVLARAVDLVRLASTHRGGGGVFEVRAAERDVHVDAGVVIEARQDARALGESLTALAEALWPGKISPENDDGGTVYSVPIGDSPQRLYWSTRGDRVIIATQRERLRALASTDRTGESLAKSEAFRSARNAAGWNADNSLIEAYADIAQLIVKSEEVLGHFGFPRLLRSADGQPVIPIPNPLNLYFAADSSRRGMHCRVFLGGDRSAGLLHLLFNEAAVVDDDLRGIPRDAYWAQVWNFDLARFWKRIDETLDPDVSAELRAPLSAFHVLFGFSLTDDLSPALGDTWLLYDAPAHGGIAMSGTVLTVELRDADAFSGMRPRIELALPKLLEQLFPTIRPHIVRADLAGQSVRVLVLGGAPVPIAPAWEVGGGRLVIGLTPQSAAAALRQLDPALRRPSLLENEEFRTARERIPGDAAMRIGYSNTRETARLLYPLALHYATALSNWAALPKRKPGPAPGNAKRPSDPQPLIDATAFAVFPPLSDVLADAHAVISATIPVPDGVVFMSEGSGPTLVNLAATGALASAVVLPAIEVAREQALRGVIEERFAAIADAIREYVDQNDGRRPPSLEALVEEGLVSSIALQSIRAPDERHPFVYIDGPISKAGPERTILVYERPVAADTVLVITADLNVRWVTLGELSGLLAEMQRGER